MTKGILRVCNSVILLKGLFHGCFLQSILFGWALFSVQGVYADLFSDWILKYSVPAQTSASLDWTLDTPGVDEWPNGDEPTYNPLSYNPFGPWITGKGISYGFISYDEKSQPFTVRFISVGTRPSALIDGFPTWEYDGTVHASSWRSSVTPVNIQFGR